MKKETPFIQSLKNIKPRDLVYPGALFLFFGIVIFTFYFVTQFISQSINKTFSPEDNGVSQSLNLERLKLVAKKLNIPVVATQDGTAAPATIPAPVTPAQATTTTQALSTPPATILDKQAITIIIKNSTAKKGVASILAKTLENLGFQKAQTANEPKSYTTTTVLIKENRLDYKPLLLEAVRSIYPDAIAATTTESTSADATIIIGSR